MTPRQTDDRDEADVLITRVRAEDADEDFERPGDEFDDQFGDDSDVESAAAPRPRGFYLTPRQTFTVLAVTLAVILVLLIGYLVWLFWPADYSVRGGNQQAGIVPVVAMYGPGRGKAPAFGSPMDATWGSKNRIYVADTKNSRIVVFSEKGEYLFDFGGFGIAKPLNGAKVSWKPGLLDYPTGIATDASNGDVYVADFYNECISVFDSEGKYLRRFPDPYKQVGKGGSGTNGTGIAVTAVAVQGDKVYATDTYQIFVFDKKGNVLTQFGMPGAGPTALDHPNGVAVDESGRIYVSDSNHNRVTAFTPQGTVIWSTGQKISDLMAETKNPFVLPRGLTVLRDGSILVADPLGQVLVKLDENGKVVATYGTRGDDPGQLNFPNAVSARKDLVLVSDRENNRIQVVRLTGK